MMNRIKKAKDKVSYGMISASNAVNSHKFPIAKLGTVSMVMSMLMMAMATISLAAEATLQENIGSGLGEVYSVLTAIAVPVAIIVVVAAAFIIFTGGEDGWRRAKKLLLYAGCALALVFIAPYVVDQVAGWFRDDGTSTYFDLSSD